MKNPLQAEIIKGIKKLKLYQQYNVLNFLQQESEKTVTFTNRLLGFNKGDKLNAMKEIHLALTIGPEQMDF